MRINFQYGENEPLYTYDENFISYDDGILPEPPKPSKKKYIVPAILGAVGLAAAAYGGSKLINKQNLTTTKTFLDSLLRNTHDWSSVDFLDSFGSSNLRQAYHNIGKSIGGGVDKDSDIIAFFRNEMAKFGSKNANFRRALVNGQYKTAGDLFAKHLDSFQGGKIIQQFLDSRRG